MAVVDNLEALLAKGTERAACPPGYNALLCWAGCPNAASARRRESCRSGLGNEHLKLGHLEQAIGHLKRTVAHDPQVLRCLETVRQSARQ
jgi:hypothetical protein